MENILVVVEVLEDKKVNIGTFYLSGEADKPWNTIKDKCQGLEFTWGKFVGELRANFYTVTLQHHKEREFLELRMTHNMTVIRHAAKFIVTSCFAVVLYL